MLGAERPSADILIIGTSIDPHINRVLDTVPDDISVARFNIDRFPKDSQLTIDQSGAEPRLYLRQDGEEVDISSPKVAWFRRIGKVGLSDSVPGKYRQFCLGEADMALEGMMSLIRPVSWINEYWATRRSANKPYQYAVARESGLHIPDTLVSNSPSLAFAWLDDHADSIVKSLHAPLITRDDSEDGRTFAFTHKLRAEDRAYLGDVATTPCQFQPSIEKAYELRVTSFGDSHIAARIDTGDNEDGKNDWRVVAGNCTYSSAQLSHASCMGLGRLIQRLGINYAASDFIVTPEGDEIFLEANPHGAWLWLDDAISSAGITKQFGAYITSLAHA